MTGKYVKQQNSEKNKDNKDEGKKEKGKNERSDVKYEKKEIEEKGKLKREGKQRTIKGNKN